MFIYSVRAQTLRLCVILAVCIVLVGVVAIGSEGEVAALSGAVEIDFGGIKTADDRLEFMRSFGIEVAEGSEEASEFGMPDNFDRVINGYNELQKRQGLDLLKYKNKRVTRYTYKVTNYKSEGEVWANLFVYRGKIIACDISSADPTGFVIPMTLVDRSNLK
jgi:hypothetical protein